VGPWFPTQVSSSRLTGYRQNSFLYNCITHAPIVLQTAGLGLAVLTS
jgi:hypothetical protein